MYKYSIGINIFRNTTNEKYDMKDIQCNVLRFVLSKAIYK